MVLKKALTYGALALGLLVLLSVVLSIVVSLVATIVGLLWTIAVSVATLFVIAAMAYTGYRTVAWLRGDAESAADRESSVAGSGTTAGQGDPVERLKRQYADGRLSEAELERRLERELGSGRTGGIDRELERERI